MLQNCYNAHRVNLLINLDFSTDLDAKNKFDFQSNSYTLANELFTYANSLSN